MTLHLFCPGLCALHSAGALLCSTNFRDLVQKVFIQAQISMLFRSQDARVQRCLAIYGGSVQVQPAAILLCSAFFDEVGGQDMPVQPHLTLRL